MGSSRSRRNRHSVIGALAALALLPVAGPPAGALTPEEAARRIAGEHRVEVLGIEEIERDGRRLYEVTVMFPPGDSNVAFQVGTLWIDPDTGEPVPRFRHRADGYELPPPPVAAPREPQGRELRRESFERDRIR